MFRYYYNTSEELIQYIMPVQQFRSYDLIVDTIPGVFVIGALLLIIPKELVGRLVGLYSPITGGAVVIVVAYVLGRTVHAISGSFSSLLEKQLAERTIKIEEETYESELLSNPLSTLLLEVRKSIPVEQGDYMIDLVMSDSVSPLSESDQETEVTSDWPTRLIGNRVYVEFLHSQDFPLDTPPKMMRYLGYSQLYSKDRLYHRYNILATFFRNLAFVFWVFSIIVISQIILLNIDVVIFGIDSYWYSLDIGDSLPLMTVFLAILFSREVYSYSNKRNLYFLIDYYHDLRNEISKENPGEE